MERLIRIVGLGCAKNFVETEIAAGSLVTHGFGLTPDEDEADMIFINTCAFLEEARIEAGKAIEDAVAWKNELPSARKIVVAGCLVEWDKDSVFKKNFPEVDAWCSGDSISKLGEVAEKVFSNERFDENPCEKKYLYDDKTPRLQLTPGHYAYLKLADGCDNCCTYCMIPSIRGALRSRDASSVVREAENLLASGVAELIVIAQDSTAFGRDRGETDGLADLMERLDSLKGDFILRLMYLHPAGVTDKLISTLSASKHVVRCIEMPLQHISGTVLQAMNRHITEERQREVVKKLRAAGFDLRTTFMTGFPGETDEDFEKLKQFVIETRFTRLGVFEYSREEGTPAALLPKRVPHKTARARACELMHIQSGISLERNRSLVGSVVDVIVDSSTGRGRAIGRTFSDAPEIDNTVIITNAKNIKDVFVKVKIEHASEYELKGKPAHD